MEMLQELRAAIRGVDVILEAGMHVSICTFPAEKIQIVL
ncbi:MAG: hypothetical protein CM15mP59_1870 [Flavobacteriaceae bacterium]|nr:MAG: hypothetical protein CM15mP59_1870 [Flavobacteriaceae bacterium]